MLRSPFRFLRCSPRGSVPRPLPEGEPPPCTRELYLLPSSRSLSRSSPSTLTSRLGEEVMKIEPLVNADGVPVQKTPYTIHDPHISLARLIPRLCRQNKILDLIANVFFRANEVVEIKDDVELYKAKRKKFQSAFFVGMSQAFTEGLDLDLQKAQNSDFYESLLLEGRGKKKRSERSLLKSSKNSRQEAPLIAHQAHQIFALFNPETVRLISPNLRPLKRRRIRNLMFQCCLRFVIHKPENFSKLDPSLLVEYAGIEACSSGGFLSLFDRLFVDVSRIQAEQLDACLNYLRGNKRGDIIFTAVRLALSVLETGPPPPSPPLDSPSCALDAEGADKLWLPLVEGSSWSLARVLRDICERQGSQLMKYFLMSAINIDEKMFLEAIRAVRARDAETGLLVQPWAYVFTEQFVEDHLKKGEKEKHLVRLTQGGDFGGSQEEQGSSLAAGQQGLLSPSGSSEETAPGFLLPLERMYFLDSAKHLSILFGLLKSLPEGSKVALQYQYVQRSGVSVGPDPPSLLAIATEDASYVIDLGLLSPCFYHQARFVIQWLLDEERLRKVIYCLPQFLLKMQLGLFQEELFGEGEERGVDMIKDGEEEYWIPGVGGEEAGWNPPNNPEDCVFGFSNVVDLRERKVKRVRKWEGRGEGIDRMERMVQVEEQTFDIHKVIEVSQDDNFGAPVLTEEVELHSGFLPLSAMASSFLGWTWDRRMAFESNWSFRPLSSEQIAFAGRDAHVMLLVEEAMEREGLEHTQVFGYKVEEGEEGGRS